MNDTCTYKLELLQQRIPIGQRYGLTLLEKAGGDLDKAEPGFKDEMLVIAKNKTGLMQEVAMQHEMSVVFHSIVKDR